ncbi:uncharacterized protein METZ01_LOCUS231909 [marine metagenome]|uniref:Uncharacterized protein n=1 Tax=marine metagenome TaxID=408172 RepID=A0A382GW04_9ZZZZ
MVGTARRRMAGRPWDRMGVGYFQGCRTLTTAQPVGKLCPSDA